MSAHPPAEVAKLFADVTTVHSGPEALGILLRVVRKLPQGSVVSLTRKNAAVLHLLSPEDLVAQGFTPVLADEIFRGTPFLKSLGAALGVEFVVGEHATPLASICARLIGS